MSYRLAFVVALLTAMPAVAAPQISVAPPAAQFGEVGVLNKRTLSFALTNTGVDLLTVLSWRIVDPMNCQCFQLQNAPNPPFLLQPGASVAFDLVASPQREGLFSASFSIDSDDPKAPNLTIPMDMTGLVKSMKIDPTRLDFGSVPVGRPSMGQDVTITNTGTTPLVVQAVRLIKSHPEQFNLTDPGMFALAPGEPRVVSVACSPLEEGTFSAAMEVLVEGFAPADVRLSCVGAREPDASSSDDLGTVTHADLAPVQRDTSAGCDGCAVGRRSTPPSAMPALLASLLLMHRQLRRRQQLHR